MREQAKVFKGEGDDAKSFIRDAQVCMPGWTSPGACEVVCRPNETVFLSVQGNIIYPCGYTGGSKERVSAAAIFEESEVSLSSAHGIDQIVKDKELQAEDVARCLVLSEVLSDEAMDHVKKMCGPGYTLDENGKQQPIEPESEGSATAKGPGFFVQPNALTPGTGVEGFFGDGKLCEDDVAYICKVLLHTLGFPISAG